jgi:c(7)-type cytochrome triheme protein
MMAHAALALLALVLVSGAADAAGPAPAAPSIFSHQAHLNRGLECASCHDVTSAAGAPGAPAMSSCTACHQLGAPELQALPKIRALGAVFPHRVHAEKLACESCHAAIAEDQEVAGPQLTPQQCISCHAEQRAGVPANACARCHGVDLKTVRPASHTPEWTKTHGAAAAWIASDAEHGQDCKQCHSKSSCTQCHDQQPPADHTGLFRMQAHGVAAEWDRDRCKTCHETGTCVRCHQITEPTNHAGPWLQLHGLAAGGQVSQSCSVCHQPAWCASCHASFTRR